MTEADPDRCDSSRIVAADGCIDLAQLTGTLWRVGRGDLGRKLDETGRPILVEKTLIVGRVILIPAAKNSNFRGGQFVVESSTPPCNPAAIIASKSCSVFVAHLPAGFTPSEETEARSRSVCAAKIGERRNFRFVRMRVTHPQLG